MNSAPMRLAKDTSFAMASLAILNSGITFLTMPPGSFSFSNTVTG